MLSSRLRLTRSLPTAPLRLYRCQHTLPPSIAQLFKTPPPLDGELTVQGYVKSVRSLKKVAFVDLNDGSTSSNLMCVLTPEQAETLKTGQSVSFTGQWVQSKGKEQAYELKIIPGSENVKTIGKVPETYPLQKKLHTLQYLRTLPTLRWRTNYLASVLRFRSFTDSKLHDFFNKEGFFKTNPPIVTSSDCEGAGELFQIESKSILEDSKKPPFFGKNAYLTVSTQLHLEVLCASLGKVWTLSPTFRAEMSDTNRHLAEFWMLEAEIAFVDSVHQLTRFTENMIKHVVKDLVEDKNGAATDLLNGQRSTDDVDQVVEKLTKRWNNLYETRWASVTYLEALQILKDSGKEFKIPLKYEDGLASEHEKWLAGEYFKGPVFVTDYPKEIKPFYMRLNDDNKTVACFDLLVPDVGEIIGGSVREHDGAKLDREIKERGMKREELDWYMSTRENGTMPHGGFGLGFERLVCYLSGVENVRDVIPFPRAHEECEA
ncbi:Asparagine--tRNA ligase, mitochondrial [Cyberlindnera fabianii]|uniref:Asparagine--tRNA ligase, mitochondrial n=1 Tax=Cyberlindnera fabianii TaxID=36022 RepID=A0A1V2L7T3_CYBFA|nr:Asparagine--tRNA ligase, mitochondrial [Cyberlindnera fabianii]